MKSRFNALDLRAITEELQPLLAGSRVINIYDHMNRSIVFKLASTSVQKHYLIMEPGVRIHLAQDALLRLDQQKKQPTGLVMKLRKCLKGRRLMRVEQCGWDRTVRLEFGYYPNQSQANNQINAEDEDEEKGEEHEKRNEDRDEENYTLKALNLFVEFFSQGNLILCEPEEGNKVLAVSRPITDIPGVAELIIGSHYTPNTASPPQVSSLEQIQGIFRINKPKELKNALRSLLPFLPLYMLDSSKSISAEYFYVQVKQFYELAFTKPLPIKAAILCDSERSFQEFLPINLKREETTVLECTTFNEAVDKYFCKLEEESSKSKQRKLEESAQAKLQAIQDEQQTRIDALRGSIDLTLEKAQVIEAEGGMVEAVSAVIRVAVENGMDWRELDDLIREEKRNGRPTALLIKKLKLDKRLVEISLPHGDGLLDLDVDFTLSLHANANWYYEQRKQAIAKLERTIKANEAALKSAKAKIDTDLFSKRSATSRALIRSSKRTLWFEKYAWFLSSDGFLVLAGHDAQQNDVLVKRHLLKDDLYVHAQVNGAASVVIKNHRIRGLIGPRTLNEAGAFSVLHSRAWEGKVVIGSWWVRAEQVSKTAPSGEYLGTGAFMVRGRKNFIPPSPLQAGFGFLFLSSKPKSEEHNKDEEGEELSEKYEKALDLTEASEDAVELVESGNVPLTTSLSTKGKYEETKRENKNEQPESTSTAATAKKRVGVRGKKGKMKKIKEKYKDQDEGERALRMALLGNPPKSQDKEEKMKSVKTNEESQTTSTKVEPRIKKKVTEVEEAVPPTEEFSVLSYLHSNPLGESSSSDLIQAVPVCGPWSALRNYKYNVKLIPQVGCGPGKGKICKNIVTLLTNNSKNNPNNAAEVELIKAVTDVDLQHALSLNKCAMQLRATDSQTLRKQNKKAKSKVE